MIAASPMKRVEQTLTADDNNVDDTNDGVIGEGMSEAELAALIAGFKEWPSLYPIVCLAAATGARRSEILALRWSDLDVDKKTLRIERALEQTKRFGIRFKSPKTRRGFRTVDLDADTVAMLLEVKRQQQRIEAGVTDQTNIDLGLVKLPANALMFPDREGQPQSPRTFTLRFAGRAAKIGFGHIRFHDLRGIHATALLDANIPIHTVAARVGDDPAILLRWYTKRRRSSQADLNLSNAIAAISRGILGK
jgi:integrase